MRLPCPLLPVPAAYAKRLVPFATLVRAIEVEALQRESWTGRPPLGRDAIHRQDLRYEPSGIKKGRARLAHASSRAARHALREGYRLFVEAYRTAAGRLRSGLFDAPFPDGSFPPAIPFRVIAGAG